ncbi:MAG: right-handed parallel beta-helix repeat-containing protein, partial [Bacteroidia bacterium]|nr:right-handed parallel beta-helix repeat-containing protein [Bacteroidia bacterium]
MKSHCMQTQVKSTVIQKKRKTTASRSTTAVLLFFILLAVTEILPAIVPVHSFVVEKKKDKTKLVFNKDIEATDFVAPQNGDIVSSAAVFSPQALFTNQGQLSQSNIPVRYRILNSSFAVVYNQVFSIPVLPAGASSIVTFPSVNLPLPGQYNIQAISELPLDEQTSNDGIMGTITVMDPLCGTYTIGYAQAFPFNTLSNAVARLNATGLSCAVTFELEDNLYASSETFPVVIHALAGAGPSAGFTLKPKAGVQPVIAGSSATGLIRLNGADYVTINGTNSGLAGSASQDLTFLNYSNSAASIIGLHSLGAGAGATHNTILNNRLIGSSTLSNAGTLFGIYSGGNAISLSGNGTDNDDNTFQHNRISKVQYGIYSAGGSASNRNANTNIHDNDLDDAEPDALTAGGIYLRYETSPVISANRIAVVRHNGTIGFSGTAFGIALGLIPANTNSVFTGDDVIGAVISGNTIREIDQSHPGGYSAFGIVINDVTTGNFFVRNNMINRVYSPALGNEFIAAILYGGGANGYIDFNTIKCYGPGMGAHSYAIAYGNGDPKIYIRNNIISFLRILTNAYRLTAIGTLSATFSNFVSGPNAFDISGGVPLVDAYGRSGGLDATGTPYTQLSSWQAATAQDLASFDAMPVFISSTDLHLTPANTALNNTALNLGVSLDIDNEPRCITPDFGADEFSTATYSPSGALSFCPGGSVTLTAGGGTAYQWSTGATSAALTTGTAGNYTVTVSEGSCSAVFSSTVTVPGTPAAAPGILRKKCYGGSGFENLHSILATADGGHLLTGESFSNDHDISDNIGSSDVWIVKTNSSGAIEWKKNYGGTDAEWGYDAVTSADGGYVVAATTLSNNGDVSGNHGSHDSWIFKISSTGTLLWQLCVGGNSSDRLTTVERTADGGFLLAGKTSSNNGDVSGNHGLEDAWLVKISSTGALQWQKCLGGTAGESFRDILLLPDGNYLFCGETTSNDGDVSGNHGNKDAWLVKTDAAGNSIWQRTLGGTASEEAAAIKACSPGGFIFTGQSNSNTGDVSGHHGGLDVWTVKLDHNGFIQWQTMSGGSGDDSGSDIVQTADGGYTVIANANSTDGNVSGLMGGTDAWMFHLNSNGAFQWQKAYGGTADDAGVKLLYNADGSYQCTGITASNDFDISGHHGDSDFWMMKLSHAAFTPFNPVNVCDLPSVTLNATAASSYSWSNGASTQSIVVSSGGVYTLTVNGCYVSDPVSVNFSSTPPATITPGGPTSFCPGSAVILQAAGGSQYLWSTGATTSSILANIADNFTVTVSDGICQEEASISTSFLSNPYTIPALSNKHCYGGSSHDLLSEVKRTADGGYIMVGSTYSTDGDVSSSHGDRDAWVIKTNAAGNIEWETSLGGTDIDWGQSVAQSSDGGFVMAGATLSNNGDVSGNHGAHDGWVVKLSSAGVLQWQRAYGGSSYDFLKKITASPDGGYVLVGKTNSGDGDLASTPGIHEAWILKINSSGVIQWSSRHGGSGTDELHSVSTCSDGGFIFAGGTFSNVGLGGFPGENGWLIKMDAGGVVEWQRMFSGDNDEAFHCIRQTADGGFIAGGYSNSTIAYMPDQHGGMDFVAAKFSPAGNLVWKKCYGGSADDIGKDIIQSSDGGYLFTGHVLSNDLQVSSNHGAKDIWLIKTNPSGTLMWQKTIGGSQDDTGENIIQLPGGHLHLAGTSASADGDINCSGSASNFWVTDLSFATISPSGPVTVCDGLPLSFTASAGSAYLWSTGETTQSITVSATGSYSVTVDGCYGSNVVDVTFSTAPTISFSPSSPVTLCSGTSVTLTAAGGSTYLWETGATTASIDVSTEGTYTVTVSNSGCSASANVTVLEAFTPDAGFSGYLDEYCAGDAPVTLVPNLPGGTFTGTGISGSSFSPTLAGSGTHRIVYTLSDGTCTDSSVAYLDVMPQGDASFTTLDPVICLNEGPIDLNPSSQMGMFYGPGVMGNTFDPAMAGAGGPYTIVRTVYPMMAHWAPPVAAGNGDGTGIFSSMQVIQGYPALAYNGYLAGSGPVASYRRALDSTGAAWGSPVVIDPSPNGGFCMSLQIVDGHPAVVYTEGVTGTTTVKYCRALDPSGNTWGSPVILASGASNTAGPYDACSFRLVNGMPAVSYCLASGVYYRLAATADGSTWNLPQAVSTIAGMVRSLDMVVVNGRPGIAYNVPVGPDYEMYYTQATGNTGTSWSTPAFIDYTADRYLSATLAHGKPAVAYVSTTGSLWYKQSGDTYGSSWPGYTMHLYQNPLSSQILFRLENIRNKPAVVYAVKPQFPFGSDNVELYYDESMDTDGYNWGSADWVSSWTTSLPDPRYFHPALAEVKGKAALSFYQEAAMELQYTRISLGHCGASSAQTIAVADPPDASFGGLLPEYCEGDPASTLSPETPGGLFSGGGISGSSFSPALAGSGYFDISYSVINNGCEATQIQSTLVRASADAGFTGPASTLCSTASPVTLIPNVPEGVFSGPGVSGLTFNPAGLSPGTYSISYQVPAEADAWPAAFNPAAGMSGISSDLEMMNGSLAMVCGNSSGHLFYSRAIDPEGNTWTTPLLLQTDNGQHPQLLMVNGHPAVVYLRNSPFYFELMYLRANDPLGNTWGSPQVLAGGVPDPFPASSLSGCKAVILDGRPCILFDVADGLHFIQALDVNGDFWGSPYLLHAGNHDNLDMVVMNGQPAVAYTHRSGFLGSATCELFYQRASDYISNTWTAPLSLDINMNSTPGMSLQQINDHPAIAFNDHLSDIVYVRAADALGTLWPLPQVLIPGTDNRSFLQLETIQGNPAVAVFRDDFYSGAFHLQLNYVKANDANGSAWSAPQNLANWNVSSYMHPSISLEMV